MMTKAFKILFIAVVIVLAAAFVLIFAHKVYLYVYVLSEAPEYPSALMYDMVIYSFDPETILTSIDSGRSDMFVPALTNPIDDADIVELWSPGTFAWGPDDYLKIANALNQNTWNEPLKNWELSMASFDILQCKDVSRIDFASIGFYQRQGNWHYLVHNMKIDSGYGLVYAGNDNGYYTGMWKDFDSDSALVGTATDALLIAEQNGGKEARLAMKDDTECRIDIFLAPFVIDQENWGWRVIYERGMSFVYGIVIDPYTGKYKTLKPDQQLTVLL